MMMSQPRAEKLFNKDIFLSGGILNFRFYEGIAERIACEHIS